MKTLKRKSGIYIIFLSLLICVFILNGCSVKNLLNETNTKLEEIQESNQRIQRQGENPSLSGTSRVSHAEFYHGNIIQTDYIEQTGQWYKVQVTERVIVSDEDRYIDVIRVGWVNSDFPNVIYSLREVSDDKRFVIENIPNEDFLSSTTSNPSFTSASSSKEDLLSQKELDQLLAAESLQFSGLTFEGKDFQYANFSNGSYRGTRFLESNLSYVFAKSNGQGETFMFDRTLISGGEHVNLNFENWNIERSQFVDLHLVDLRFFDTTLGTLAGGSHFTFRNAEIERAKFESSQDGRGIFRNVSHINTDYISPRFTSIDFYGGVHFTTKFIDPVFVDGMWSGVIFNNSQASPSRIQGGGFSNFVFFSGSMQAIIIEKLGLVYPEFEAVSFTSTNLSDASISAWFRDGSIANGGAKFVNTDFTDSIFDGFQFGQEVGRRVDLRNADFSEVEFRGNNKFVNCNVEGATFPSNMSNVTFDNCPGSPY